MDKYFDGRPQINPYEFPVVKCPKCGGFYFEQAFTIRLVNKMVIGQGVGTQPVPAPVFICKKCGTMSPQDAEVNNIDENGDLINQSSETVKTDNNIII